MATVDPIVSGPTWISYIKDTSLISHPIRTMGIPYGEVDSTSTSTEYTATVPGISKLKNGVVMLLRNGVVTSASGFTININNLGDKPVYSNLATGNDITPTDPTRDTTIFNINYTMLFIYDENIVSDGGWICYRGYDANTNTIGYQLRTNSGNLPALDTGYRYRLWLTSADGKHWVPINTSTATNATTSRTLNSHPIDPFGAIVYNSTNGTVNKDARPAVTTLWQQYTLTIGYSYVVSLTAWRPVYLQCTPQTDGSAVMNNITQTLPTSDDGKIYIFLGLAYSATAMELSVDHPVYYHDGTGIRIWNGARPVTAVVSTAAAGLAPKLSGSATQYLNGNGNWTTPPNDNTTYAAGTGLTLNNNSFNLSTVVAGGSAGPTAAVTGNDGTTVAIPRITVDNYGRVTSFTTYTLTNKNTNTTYADATESAHGLMTAADKQKLNNLTTVMRYMGVVASVANLPSLTTADAGKVYHVTADGGEYAWDGSEWQELGSHIDLSNYLTGVNKSTTTIKNPTAKTVVTGGTTTAIPNITKKTVVTGATTETINIAASKNVVTAVTPANVVTGWTTASITPVTKKTVVTGVTKKTVVTDATTGTIKNPTAKTVVLGATTATIKNPSAKTVVIGASTATIKDPTSKNVVVGLTTTTIKNPTAKTVVTNASTTSAIISGGTTNITPVSKKTVVISGNNVSINNPTSKSVVTTVTPATVVTNVSTTSISIPAKKTVVTSASTKAAVTSVTTATISTAASKTVVTGVTKKTVVTAATPSSASFSGGILTFTFGSVTTGDSVSVSTGASITTGNATVATGYSTGSVVGSVETGDSVTAGSAVTVLNASTKGAAASVTTGASITTTPTTVVGSLNTGDSITTGTAVSVINSLTTGSVIGSVTTGDSITTANVDVATGATTGASITTTNTTVLTGVTTGDSITTSNATVVTGVSTGDSITTSNTTVVTGITKGDSVDVSTGDSVTNGTTQAVIASLSTGAAASVTTGASITTSPATVVKSVTTGDSVTVGTAINAYTGLTTGDSITTTNTTVVTDVTGVK